MASRQRCLAIVLWALQLRAPCEHGILCVCAQYDAKDVQA